jgi:hypothetical protein
VGHARIVVVNVATADAVRRKGCRCANAHAWIAIIDHEVDMADTSLDDGIGACWCTTLKGAWLKRYIEISPARGISSLC